jgi:hypothetical protein
MKVGFFIVISFFFIQLNSSAQVKVKNETISAFGTGTSLDLREFSIQQSIGQSSVIGSFYNEELKINQGFLQGLPMGFENSSEAMMVLPFPNPFKDRVTFQFLPGISEEVALSVYDMFGRLLLTEQLIALDNELTVDLNHLSNALYQVFFWSGNQVYHTRIIKSL